MVQEHLRYDRPLSVLILDIDDFKLVNDKYGHQTGDEVLKRLGKLLMEEVRKSDFPARYGGEEVAVIFPETSLDQAAEMAERLRLSVCRCFDKNGPCITVSIGVSYIHEPDIITARDLVRQADIALYKAKQSGKNKLVCS